MAEEKKDTDDHLLVGSVVKAFRVLEAFDRPHRSMGFSEISRVTGLEKSAAQRAAHTLWRLGYLEKTPGSGEYRLSLRCQDIGMRFAETNRIVEAVAPYISLLRRKTQASVNLTMLDGTETVFVQRHTTVDMLGNKLGVRARLPAYCTATGIAMLARLPDDEVRDVLARSDLRPVMPNTVWQTDRILERIGETRAQRYAFGVEEDMASDITLACGFTDPATGDVAAIGLSYFSGTTSVEEVHAQARDLLVSVVDNLAGELAGN
ncbi:IclR family transcriptional regulator [Shinella yambaruensis]|uniref:Transcriptional regulator n=1 Tax=Shinella yambaruensis TaxID=415996 RepID=A0ABQ5ZKG5_9HYPH|nr:IclR family transcriptional regulator [Shinella yambaruensis]MCJ8027257.1 IclR family transcriptional regulator [Shinella yambaruensis]MCU7981313.1 IclR family transcriptional regulator [Shinella yambaruensis]GLR52530.1 transcriptional regulator [Shinella yambaruensis]